MEGVGPLSTETSRFPCNQCGLCCQNIRLSEETRYLDRGDGTCRHYEPASRSCAIYNQRPDVCRVDRVYRSRYAYQHSWPEFVEMNLRVCHALGSPLNRELLDRLGGGCPPT